MKRGVCGLMLIILSGVVLAIALIVFYAESQRTTDDWWDDAEPVVIEFFDQSITASNTSRIALSSIVADMKTTRRKFQNIDAPADAANAKQAVDDAMASTIAVFQDFMADSDMPDAELQLRQSEMGDKWTAARSELNKLGLTIHSD